MGMAIDDLMAEAAALVEDRPHDPVALTLLRDDLAAAQVACEDLALATDAGGMLVQLDRAITRDARHHALPLAS